MATFNEVFAWMSGFLWGLATYSTFINIKNRRGGRGV